MDQLRRNRLVAQVIPVSLGDNFRGFRIVGTEPALIEHYGARLAGGALWTAPMQAVIGSEVARVTQLAVGGALSGTHGLAQGGAVHEEARYEVVGVLAPTGTVLDRLVLTDKASVWRVHEGDPADDAERRILEEEREVTALLVRYASPLAAAIVPRQVNAESRLMAASPANELARLFAVMGVGIDTMRVFGGVLIASSLLALFVTLYNALEERRYDIAIMRLLGASRARVAILLLIESWLLALVALLAGLALGLAAVADRGQLAGAVARLRRVARRLGARTAVDWYRRRRRRNAGGCVAGLAGEPHGHCRDAGARLKESADEMVDRSRARVAARRDGAGPGPGEELDARAEVEGGGAPQRRHRPPPADGAGA